MLHQFNQDIKAPNVLKPWPTKTQSSILFV